MINLLRILAAFALHFSLFSFSAFSLNLVFQYRLAGDTAISPTRYLFLPEDRWQAYIQRAPVLVANYDYLLGEFKGNQQAQCFIADLSLYSALVHLFYTEMNSSEVEIRDIRISEENYTTFSLTLATYAFVRLANVSFPSNYFEIPNGAEQHSLNQLRGHPVVFSFSVEDRRSGGGRNIWYLARANTLPRLLQGTPQNSLIAQSSGRLPVRSTSPLYVTISGPNLHGLAEISAAASAVEQFSLLPDILSPEGQRVAVRLQSAVFSRDEEGRGNSSSAAARATITTMSAELGFSSLF